MIELIIFDLDGVLVDAKEFHYSALNGALATIDSKYMISREEHLAKYDGLSTSQKLKLLSKEKGLPKHLHDYIWKRKQELTETLIDMHVQPDDNLMAVLEALKADGFKLAVASNAIKSTVYKMLHAAGIRKYFEYVLSNESVAIPKPSPAIYLECMLSFGVAPIDTLIIEDSLVGRQATYASGAHLLPVNSPKEITYERIIDRINEIAGAPSKPWEDKNLNILIPMAGGGSRFAAAGYTFPKPLIDVDGKPMIQVVVDNLNMRGNYIFIVQKEHYEKYNLNYVLPLIAPNCKIIQTDGITEGAACTTLLAKEFINNNSPLVIANSDQYVNWNSSEFMYSMVGDAIDGGILTFNSTHPKWSYAKVDENGWVTEVAEKKPISNLATVGIYYWARGSDYVKYAEQMIDKNIRVNNEFYVCPVYNEAIADGKRIKTYNAKKMWGIGTPEDLQEFMRTR